MFVEKIKLIKMDRFGIPASLLCDVFVKFSGSSFIKDENCRFVFVNNKWSETLGYSGAEMIGKNYVDSVTDDQKEEWSPMEEAVLISGEEQILVQRLYKNDGSPLVIKTRKNLYVSDEGKKFIIGTVEDITEIDEARKDLEESNLALQKSNEEKDKFFSIIAHDLRSPFTGFLGLTDYMADKIESMSLMEIKENVLSMKDSAINFHNLLENLLKWSLLQRQMTDFITETINLKNSIDSNIKSIHEVADKKWIEIINNVPDNLFVSADKNMIHSIFINLLTNAIKFTHKRGAIIISTNSESSDDFIQISIKDTGVGMNEYTIKRLFEVSSKIVSSRGTDDEQGTGLGLILCKDFIEKHGGKIWVESEQNVGSTFLFTLPRAN